MLFACLRCREHVHVPLGPRGHVEPEKSPDQCEDERDSDLPQAPQVRTPREDGPVEDLSVSSDGTTPSAARCCRCDGLFHALCLGIAPETTEFVCPTCCGDFPSSSSALPLLVPAPVIAFTASTDGLESSLAAFSDPAEPRDGVHPTADRAMGDFDGSDIELLTASIDVCGLCREWGIPDADRVPCPRCPPMQGCVHHRPCLEPVGDSMGPPAAVNKTSRKRKRSGSGDHSPRSCCVDGIHAMRVPMVVRGEGQLEPWIWSEACRTCDRCFVVTDEDDNSDGVVGIDRHDGWQCARCADYYQVPVTDPELTTGPSPPPPMVFVEEPVEEESRVLLCDGCDGEFSMASLDPPLTEVPEGDWFCPACKQTAKPTKELPTIAHIDEALPAAPAAPAALESAPAVTVEMVTVLICDGCEGEYPLASISPPLESIPDGDWFCPACDSSKAKTATTAPAEQDVVTEMPSIPVVDAVTLLICDYCDGEFDLSKCNPPLEEVPRGEWFCDVCELKRKKAKKSKAMFKKSGEYRRQLAAASAANAASQTEKVMPARQSSGTGVLIPVTLLICDGCDGEFDMAQVRPPLSKVPDGEWFCSVCVVSRTSRSHGQRLKVGTMSNRGHNNKSSTKESKTNSTCESFCSQCKIKMPSSANWKETSTCSACSVTPLSRVHITEESGRSKRSRKAGDGDGQLVNGDRRATRINEPSDSTATQALEFGDSSIYPVPVTSTFASGRSDALPAVNNGDRYLAICSDDENAMDSDEEDHIVIVCDICLGEFRMVDVLGIDDEANIPARPWYCKPCLKRLKKNRKKKQRISKQMLLEMQIYGGLLRATSAKVVDPVARSKRGKPPVRDEEIISLFSLVGQRVGIFLQWDKVWLIGRVIYYDPSTSNHLVQFADDTERWLPLYGLPVVIGTSSIIEVKSPVFANQWCPAQVFRMNPLAERSMLQRSDHDDDNMLDSVLSGFRLVSVFSGDNQDGKTRDVACWIPKQFCRRLREDVGMKSSNTSKSSATERARAELITKQAIVDHVFRREMEVMTPQKWKCIGDVFVASTAVWQEHEYIVRNFDAVSGVLVLGMTDEDVSADFPRLDLANALDSVRPSSSLVAKVCFASWRVDCEKVCSFKTLPRMPIDNELDMSATLQMDKMNAPARTNASVSNSICDACSLPAIIDGDNDKLDSGSLSLIACTHCGQSFHKHCCDPPHDLFPLLSDEDGDVLIEDIGAKFICRDCVLCDGCQKKRSDPDFSPETRWFRWRLPLKVATLCSDCVVQFDNCNYCSVCACIIEEDLIDRSASLVQCTTCSLWVHPTCEPDPHPVFRRIGAVKQDTFTLDVDIAIPSLGLQTGGTCQLEDDGDSSAATGEPQNEEIDEGGDEGDADGKDYVGCTGSTGGTRSARAAEEALAFALQFSDAYDARILHNYECLTCRKIRMLKMLHRLVLEDKIDLFKEPVTVDIAPTYFDVIKQPMDLRTMREKVLSNAYTRVNFRGFRDDFELLCLNAVTFNSRDRDFLIWREAWRFYNQGQRILRQIAPKTRMRSRGGRFYDALVIAAKRQLPNNSVIGKKTIGGEADSDCDDGGDIDRDSDVDKEEEDVFDSSFMALQDSETNERGKPDGRECLQLLNTDVSDRIPDNVGTPHQENLEPAVSAVSKPSEITSNGFGKILVPADRRRQNEVSLFSLQSELRGTPPGPKSLIKFHMLLQSRVGAHSCCWIDLCGVCGSTPCTGTTPDSSIAWIFCVDCGEGFHSFCVDVDVSKMVDPKHHMRSYWRCTNCSLCEVCGKPSNTATNCSTQITTTSEDHPATLLCNQCDRRFHASCLVPSLDESTLVEDCNTDIVWNHGRGIPGTFYCASCVTCEECSQPQSSGSYSFDKDRCLTCCRAKHSADNQLLAQSKPLLQIWSSESRRQRAQAERCPICRQRWNSDDDDLIQCDACECWVHPTCDELFSDNPGRYETLVADPNAQYVCGSCRVHTRDHIDAIGAQQNDEGRVGTPTLAKCQLLLSKIQATRVLCDARWCESRDQLSKTEQWQTWKEHIAIYLYVLRIGEECLKTFAFKSVNFYSNWELCSRQTELAGKGLNNAIPLWLVQKATRYLRFKRYARGPRAALRKQGRKNDHFYSQQGIDRLRDPSAIATIVAEASNCAAMLVCVHLFYGWRPLQRIIVHLLERGRASERINDALLSMVVVDDNQTLEQEIAMIRQQYERRAGKRHVVPGQNGQISDDVDQEVAMEASEISVGGPSITTVAAPRNSEVAQEESNGLPPLLASHIANSSNGANYFRPSPISCGLLPSSPLKTSAVKVPINEDTKGVGISQVQEISGSDAELCASLSKTMLNANGNGVWDGGEETPTNRTQGAENGVGASSSASPTGTPHAPIDEVLHMTVAESLNAWCSRPRESVSQDNSTPALASTAFTDNRFCSLCFIVGDSPSCGRLVYVELDQWMHISCALWSSEVHQDAHGIMHKCQRALSRSKLNRCDACGVVGATVGCCISRCQRHYHFPCAVDAGVTFLPNRDTCCPQPSHMQMLVKKIQIPLTQSGSATLPLNSDEQAQSSQSKYEGDDCGETSHMDQRAVIAGNELEYGTLSADRVMQEPKTSLRVDFANVLADSKKRMRTLRLKRQICFRIGALTVHSLGHIVIGNPTFYSRDAIFPLGYRSTRIFWSTQYVEKRCLYECVVSSSDVEARAERKKKRNCEPRVDNESDLRRPSMNSTSIFKITPSDDPNHPIVAQSASEALLELRSRLVALYEDEPRGFANRRNPFLLRSSWFSFGLISSHFFGFGIPEIAEEIERLPHAETTAISRPYVLRRYRQHHQSHKRKRGNEGNSELDLNSCPVYQFAYRLPTPAELALAMREVEEVVETEERARMSTGAIRADGLEREEPEDVQVRVTRRRLNKDATRDTELLPSERAAAAASAGNSTNANAATNAPAPTGGDGAMTKEKSGGIAMDLEHLPIAMQYRELRRRPFDDRLLVKKSRIHGYGLFTKEKMVEGQMIVEYQGQMISQEVADERERKYEEMGIGSCYMFRLDERTIIDATRCGNLARFMNHSCDPKAFARVVTVENNEKKIVIFAKRTIEAGEEVTYDYKFPIEDEAIRCDCGAPNCIGRMN